MTKPTDTITVEIHCSRFDSYTTIPVAGCKREMKGQFTLQEVSAMVTKMTRECRDEVNGRVEVLRDQEEIEAEKLKEAQ